jgi:hypothetical protein
LPWKTPFNLNACPLNLKDGVSPPVERHIPCWALWPQNSFFLLESGVETLVAAFVMPASYSAPNVTSPPTKLGLDASRHDELLSFVPRRRRTIFSRRFILHRSGGGSDP